MLAIAHCYYYRFPSDAGRYQLAQAVSASLYMNWNEFRTIVEAEQRRYVNW